MTHWEDVVKQTAINLNIPEEFVRDHILDIALHLRDKLENPTYQEISIFGIGSFKGGPKRLEFKLIRMRSDLKVKKSMLEATTKKWVLDTLPGDIEKLEEDIKSIEGFLKTCYENHFRIKTLGERRPRLNATIKDIFPNTKIINNQVNLKYYGISKKGEEKKFKPK